VGEGEVTKEALQEAKRLAAQEFNERRESTAALPAIYSVMMNQMMKQSAKAMQNLSKEDRKKMDEIISKSKEEPTSEEEASTDQSE
jgi:hypothetical protein